MTLVLRASVRVILPPLLGAGGALAAALLLAYRVPSVIEMLPDNGPPCIAKDTQIFARQLDLKPCSTPVQSPQSKGISFTGSLEPVAFARSPFVKTLKRDYV